LNKVSIYIIGLGGIGSCLCEPICRYINYLENRRDYDIILIDGDSYDDGNLARQYFEWDEIGENKAEVQAKKMKNKFEELDIKTEAIYINSQNIKNTIVDNSIILSGVDNHKTRKIIQDHCNKLSNCLYISGGNFYIDGDVIIFAKKDGVQLSPTIYQDHKDIANPTDRTPDEIGCDELVESVPQLLFTNGTVSICMQWAFYNYYKLFQENNISIYKNKISFDICEMSVISRNRPII